MAYGKSRATGYTDFYKNNTRTPGGSTDDEEETKDPRKSTMPVTGARPTPNMAEKRKEALRRRLAKLKAGK